MFIKLIFIIIVLALNSCKCSLNEKEKHEEENSSETKSMEENLKKLENQKKDHEQLVERDNLIYLSELPLDKLLQVKKSIEEIIKADSNDIVYDEDYEDFQFANDKIKRIVNDADDDDKWNKQRANQSASNRMEHIDNDKARIINAGNYLAAPTALPLINNYNYNRHFNRKSGLEPWDTKPSKIQTIFQLSVTALAFLAFAGYLLCMIVQAIKSKGTTYMYPTTGGFPTTGVTTSAIKKRKPFGRRRREIFLSADNRNDTIDSIYHDSLATPDPDQMFQVMVNFAEGYVRFNHLY